MKTLTTPQAVTLNADQRLFVIPEAGGYSCLGFDVCHKWTAAIAGELGRADLMPVESERGTLAAYARYQKASEAARQSAASGKRLTCMLTPQLIGLEGKRVEVVNLAGEIRRFIVGKSTGWLPIHLEIKTQRSLGGFGVMDEKFKSVRVI